MKQESRKYQPMKPEDLRYDFQNETGDTWIFYNGYINFDYVLWLENKILSIKNTIHTNK